MLLVAAKIDRLMPWALAASSASIVALLASICLRKRISRRDEAETRGESANNGKIASAAAKPIQPSVAANAKAATGSNNEATMKATPAPNPSVRSVRSVRSVPSVPSVPSSPSSPSSPSAPSAAVPVWATHELVRLTSAEGPPFTHLTVLVDRREQRRAVVSLARENEPYGRLRVDAAKGGLRFDGGGNRDATWVVTPACTAAAAAAAASAALAGCSSYSSSSSIEPGRFVHLRSNAARNGATAAAAASRAKGPWWLATPAVHKAAEGRDLTAIVGDEGGSGGEQWQMQQSGEEGDEEEVLVAGVGVVQSGNAADAGESSGQEECGGGGGKSGHDGPRAEAVPPHALWRRCTWRAEAVDATPYTRPCSADGGAVGGAVGHGGATAGGGRAQLSEGGRTAALSPEEIDRFVRDGFVVCRAAAPRAGVEKALALINARLGQGGKGGGGGGGVTRLRGDVSNAGETAGLVNTPAIARLVAQLLGGADQVGSSGCQVALRFPRSADALVAGGAACQHAVGPRSWHTDGLRQGRKHSFSLLVGVALSDTAGAGGGRGGGGGVDEGGGGGGGPPSRTPPLLEGQLHVWPGSHVPCCALMRWPDGKIRRDGKAAVDWDSGGRDGARAAGAKELLPGATAGRQQPTPGAAVAEKQNDGKALHGRKVKKAEAGESASGESAGYEDGDGPLPSLPMAPLRLDLSAGDVVLAHHALAHCGGPHLGCDLRYMLYFRVRHVRYHELVKAQALEEGKLYADLPAARPYAERQAAEHQT